MKHYDTKAYGEVTLSTSIWLHPAPPPPVTIGERVAQAPETILHAVGKGSPRTCRDSEECRLLGSYAVRIL
jgi:hypothetical protein